MLEHFGLPLLAGIRAEVIPSWSWLLTKWSLEPTVLLGVLALTAAYAYACRGLRFWPVRRAAVRCTRFQLSMFGLAQATLLLALLSPLDYVGDRFLFSAHMIQHLILAAVWPALLLLSIPEPLAAPLFRTLVGRVLRLLTLPVVAFLIFNATLALWHITIWYNLTLTNDPAHILEHLVFMAAGLMVWWPVLGPVRSHRLTYGPQELYLFANLFPMMALGVFYSFWRHPLYGAYITAPRLWGIPALTDQQIGGLIMWMPGNVPFALAMLIIGMTWLERGDPRELPTVSPANEVS